ncbi:hypothetical protein CEXT_363301 [Caerostris extrusa]|uniref:Secreted protein n=1 Tax=Caerostris extrusa TaxID=172846 RepID=A0AAV4PI63_CAEEX|nr:hypothetical protein CEXT_363301 [Caerostris extrusa]
MKSWSPLSPILRCSLLFKVDLGMGGEKHYPTSDTICILSVTMATIPLHAHDYRSHTYTFPSDTLGARSSVGLCEKLEKSKKK